MERLQDFSTEALFNAASDGNISRLKEILQHNKNPNERNENGWTALMIAARNGQDQSVDFLLKNGSDASLMNYIGQTALDIAKFWNHKVTQDILSSGQRAFSVRPEYKNFFSENPLDRHAHVRTDTDWIAKYSIHPHTVYIVFRNLTPLMIGKEHISLAQLNYSLLEKLLIKNNQVMKLFLGVKHNKDKTLNDNKFQAWFAVDLSCVEETELTGLLKDSYLISDPRMALMSFSDNDAAIAAQARSLFAWHDRHRFCSTCGSPTVSKDCGYRRQCMETDCRSNKGVNNTSHPRLDPSVIMAVSNRSKFNLLLGRGHNFPKNVYSCLAGFVEYGVHNTCYPRTDPVVIMAVTSADCLKLLLGCNKQRSSDYYSCLAGFIESGETIENAVRREVLEESGIEIEQVQYHSSQPWPMPGSLMIGCLAFAVNDKIVVDKSELQDARWFSREDVGKMVAGQHPTIKIPPKQAIAHHLIKAWLSLTSNL